MKSLGLLHSFLLLALILVSACKGGGGASKYSFLDSTDTSTNISPPVAISISTFSPSADPFIMTNNQTETFAVSLASSDSSVTYTFLLDDTTTLQSGNTPYYTLSTSSMTAGAHTLKVTASNSTSSDNHVFNIRINSPTVINSFTPTLTGTTIACGVDHSTISALYSDADVSDSQLIKWYLNGSQINFGNSMATVSNDTANKIASVNYHPDCTQTGINIIRLDINDGHQTTTQTWSIYVESPITVSIASSTPTTDPVVMTNSSNTTFAVTLAVPDPTTKYQFILDTTITLQNDFSTYYTLAGSSLSTGSHTLKVIAYNSSSTDTKIFHIIKNTPPSTTGYSPALTANSISCGTSPISFYADMVDANSFPLTFTWTMDGVVSSYITPTNTSSRGSMNFVPNCLLAGSHSIQLSVSDGYDTTNITWSVTITAPITVHIASYSPTTSPLILTSNSSTTFTVALTTSDSSVSYDFLLDGTNDLYNGPNPYYILNANSLAAGPHTLKVTASNSSSSDNHSYSFTVNSAPTVSSFTPTLTGTTLACGHDTVTLIAHYTDADVTDTDTPSWYLNGTLVNGANSFVTLANDTANKTASVTYHPDCTQNGINSIRLDLNDTHEITSKTWTITVSPPISIAISSFTPTSSPVQMTSSTSTTFGVSLATQDPTATYLFVLDNATTVQNSTTPYYTTTGSALTAGDHSLKVTAANSTSSDIHTFSIHVNSPTTINSFIPNLTGTTLNCGMESVSISALYSDTDAGDTISPTWNLNASLISFGSTTATVSNDTVNKIATVNFHPDCTQTGINFIQLNLNDGHEITTQTWTIYVAAPISIHIANSTPVTSPVVMTGASSTTFGVTLTTADPTANYQFLFDGVTTLQNTHQTYYTLAGTSLTAGTHTLKVIASNATSSDNHTFTIRKNTVPATTGYSPALTANTLACGTTGTTFYADMVDADGDPMTYSWTLDDNISSYITASNTSSRGSMVFIPNCAITGAHTIKLTINDGYESSTVSWSVTITAPITVQISSFLPSTNPTIMTANSNTTFAVALNTSDASVSYQFDLTNLSNNTTTTLQHSSVPFYNLAASSISAGNYTLKVTASNGTSQDSHTFTIRKNSPPAVPPSPLTYSPALTGTILNCGADSQLIKSPISDADGDIMSATWSLNGNSSDPTLSSSYTQSLAQTTFTPTCAQIGTQTITLSVFDGYETTNLSWIITVVNPTVVSINSYSPATSPIWILSTGSQIFSVGATGKAPLVYTWVLDGNTLSTSNEFVTLAAASLTTGSHTLVVTVNDSTSQQSHTFNIMKNSPPVLSGVSPTNATPAVNINTIISFSANYTDANGDTMTPTWKINGTTVSAGNANGSVTSGSGTSVMVFTPTANLIGNNTISLSVSDGKETTTQTWTLNITYFQDVCNNLGAFKACTLIGNTGRGSNISVAANTTAVQIHPLFLAPYGATNSYFASDDATHVVWFYNKGASTVNILGQSIPAGYIKSVLGTGMSGAGVTGTAWNDYSLNNPRGIAWDTVNNRLFVADESNNKVLMVDNTGNVTVIMSNSGSNIAANNANGSALPSGTWCNAPRGLAFDSTNQKLYVACASSSTVKVIDTSNATTSLWTASILSGGAAGGVITAGSTDGTNGGTNLFSAPYALKLDTDNNILYVTDNGHCKVKAINLTASAKTNYYYGALTLPASSTITISGINGANATACTTYTTNTAYGATRYNGGSMGIELYKTGVTMKGFFVTDDNSHRMAFTNNSAASITLGGIATASYQSQTVWNGSGTPSSGGGTGSYYMPCSAGAGGSSCYIYNPRNMLVQNNTLFLADYNNNRIRSLDISTTNGTVSDDLGFDKKAGYAGNGGTSSTNVQFNQPLNLYFDSSSGKLIISDFYNYRFRSLNLTTGRIDSFIGNGWAANNNSQVDPTVVGTQGPRGVTNYQNFYIYADTQNSNCQVRAWNTLASTQNIFGVTTFTNAIQTIAGNYLQGCGNWTPPVGTPVLGSDLTAKLNNPTGITNDGTNLYFADTNAHCILKMNSSGYISTLAGVCGTSGAANGSQSSFTGVPTPIYFNLPLAVVADPRYPTSGNLFILDQNGTAVATKIRYINQGSTAVTVFGVTINPGNIATVYTAPDGHGADLATFDTQLCYSTGGDWNYSNNATSTNSNHNVVCLNRDDATGTQFVRFGRNPSTYISHGYMQEGNEEEGQDARTSISFAGPSGLAFDSNGNLYIAERNGHDIRLVKRWW